MVRRLEKIEKEMGYCEIKIEKGQRVVLQLDFLKLHRSALVDAIRRFEATHNAEIGEGNLLGGMTHLEVYHEVSLDPESEKIQQLREIFRCIGAFPLLIEEREIIDREIEEIEEKLQSFNAFLEKRRGLVTERNETLSTFDMHGEDAIDQISKEFERTEHNWNTLTEDLINIDEAIFYVTRSADYLRSARNFILSARSKFPIDSWIREGYLIDLFKHSTVGRAKEMVEGADRNLKMALMELICLDELALNPEDFEHLLLPFLDTLFDDLFLNGKLSETLKLLEARVERVEEFRKSLKEERQRILDSQTEHEENRERLFHQIGDERRKLTLAP